MSWLFLIGAILCECAATFSLRMEALGASKKWLVIVVIAFPAAFGFLALALAKGMSIGVAYGVWTALGVVLTALVSRAFFGDPLSRVMCMGIGLVVAGVMCIELGAVH